MGFQCRYNAQWILFHSYIHIVGEYLDDVHDFGGITDLLPSNGNNVTLATTPQWNWPMNPCGADKVDSCKVWLE